MLASPNFTDILKARKKIMPYLYKTPLLHYPRLSKELGFEAYVKHENVQLTGAFKIRGGINLVSQLSPEEKTQGVIAASTGNHGQSIALASKIFGVKATVVVQEGANPDKLEAIRSFGANIIVQGKDFDEAIEYAQKIAKERGIRYIHHVNEPLLIAGVGTTGLEIMEDLPDVDAVIVPVGGGTQASGVALALKTIASDVEVIAVQAENAPSVYLSWKKGELVSTDMVNTIADGLATRKAYSMAVSMMRELIDDFILVSEEEMKAAIRMYVDKAHTIAEAAGAAPLAGALKIRERLRNKKVVLILSGGNITFDMLHSIL
jgi:threonine dehydratase